jgi:hypothetical protein
MISIDIRATPMPRCNTLNLMAFLDSAGAFSVSDLNSPERSVLEKDRINTQAGIDSIGSVAFWGGLVYVCIEVLQW